MNKIFHDVCTWLIKSLINCFIYCWTYLFIFWYLFLNSFLHWLFVHTFLLFVNYLIWTITDAEPELINSIIANVRTVTDTKGGLKELSYLLEEFDEKKVGFVGQRAFLIACSRSRYFIYLLCLFHKNCYNHYLIIILYASSECKVVCKYSFIFKDFWSYNCCYCILFYVFLCCDI